MKGWNKEDLGVDSVVFSGVVAFFATSSPISAWPGGAGGGVSEQAGSREGRQALTWRLRPLQCLISFSSNLCFNLMGSLCLEQIVNNASLLPSRGVMSGSQAIRRHQTEEPRIEEAVQVQIPVYTGCSKS